MNKHSADKPDHFGITPNSAPKLNVIRIADYIHRQKIAKLEEQRREINDLLAKMDNNLLSDDECAFIVRDRVPRATVFIKRGLITAHVSGMPRQFKIHEFLINALQKELSHLDQIEATILQSRSSSD